jgi:putative membrane protein
MHYLAIVAVATNKSKQTLWKETVNKDLILRERLALQRTIKTNYSFSFCTCIFCFGLSTRNLLNWKQHSNRVSFYLIAFVILILGIVNFFKQRKMITENEKHIGDYKLDYEWWIMLCCILWQTLRSRLLGCTIQSKDHWLGFRLGISQLKII